MKKYAIALGSFDGLHIGHMAVIRSIAACGFAPAVLLLEPLPRVAFGSAAPKLLLFGSEREEILTQTGAELLRVDFNKIKNYSPEEFFNRVLLGSFNASALGCGYNYRFGCGGSGSSETLKALCSNSGVRLEIVPPVEYEGEPVSSTRIRAALESGEIKKANAMLGREFGYRLTVVHGDHIGGRLLGCPTINQLFPEQAVVPKYGVYSSRTKVGDKWLRSVTNIGCRPSFASSEQRSETHIIGFDGDLYGQDIEVRLCEYKRGEIKFDSLDALREQLKKDRE